MPVLEPPIWRRRAGCEQVKSLAQLGWFLSLGTAAQLFAVVIVVAKLLASPLPDVATELVHTGEPATAVVAVMNLIFA